MNLGYDFSISSENPVIKAYDYWNARQYLFNIEEEKHQKQEDVYMYQQIRQRIIDECKNENMDYIVNTLVAYLYTVRTTSPKKTLWACFGDIIVENLKKNLEGKGKVCKICGKRFAPVNSKQLMCSKECYQENDRRQAILRKKFVR